MLELHRRIIGLDGSIVSITARFNCFILSSLGTLLIRVISTSKRYIAIDLIFSSCENKSQYNWATINIAGVPWIVVDSSLQILILRRRKTVPVKEGVYDPR